MITGCAITSLNSPSNLEITVSPSPHCASQSEFFTQTEGVLHYGDCTLPVFALSVPPSIGLVASSRLEHAETDACDVAGNSVPGVVLAAAWCGETLSIEKNVKRKRFRLTNR